MEPDWLVWARRIQALAQTGLAFTKDGYDRERYEALTALAAEMMAARSTGDPARIEDALRRADRLCHAKGRCARRRVRR